MQSRSTSRRHRIRALVGVPVIALLLPLGAAPAGADVESGTLPGGTSITAEVATPADGALVASPSGDVTLTGTASVGQGQASANTAVIYVLDASGSTQVSGGCGGNQNSDSSSNSVLDCEIAAAKALNQQAIAAGTVGEVGVVAFGTTAAPADVSPGGSAQLVTGPATDANNSGGPDVEEVLSSIQVGRVNRFTLRSFDVGTNYEDAVRKACGLAQQTTMSNVLVVFLSDGEAQAGGSALDDLPCRPKPATFRTFAVGSASSCTNTGGGRGSLAQIAAATGGTCTQVVNLATLPAVVPGVLGARLTRLSLSVDGGAAQDISSSADRTLPQPSPVAVTYSLTVSALAPGAHQLCVTAHGSDGGGPGSVTDCHSVTVATVSVSPPTANAELGTPGQTHTVTADVAAGVAGGVASVPVSFSVTAGPNAGSSGTTNTDANGEASFTYTAAQGPAGLGTDQIQACFTDSQGTTSCATATATWGDTTPPQVDCAQGGNPAGNIPGGGRGQSSPGFYTLTATDAVDPDPMITVTDPASGATFGPFPSGTRIKVTQAPGATPGQKSGTGDVDWHITVNGDPALTATDASGNTSAPVICPLPPPSR